MIELFHNFMFFMHEFFADLKEAPIGEKTGFFSTQAGGVTIMGSSFAINSWSEVALIFGMLVGAIGVLIQYKAYKSRQKHDDRMAMIRMAEAAAKGADVSGI